MGDTANTAKALIQRIQRKAPEYLDLLTANTDAEFLEAMDAILGKAVAGLESNSKNFKNLPEEGLTGAIRLAIEIPGLTVSQEENSNGHVDLTIVADHCVPIRKVLFEAKIYRSPSKYIEGLNQLINRYITGRELRGILVVYYLEEGIANRIKTIRDKMDSECPCFQQGKTRNHTLKWSFLSTHSHSSGENLEVGHIGCNLYHEGITSSQQITN